MLLLTIDTLRADHLGCYGYGLARTPEIDALAADGVRCDDAISSAPITLPSHSTILTGLYPPAHGVRDNGSYSLGDRAVTLAERFSAAGYGTQAFVSALVLNRRYNLTQGFDGYDDDLWAEDSPPLFLIRRRPGGKTVEKAIEWLEKRENARDRRPFFLWIHLFDPHQPYRSRGVLAPTPYDGEIASVDRAIGKLLAKLRDDRLLDGTLVVFTADHGESLGEHGEKTHAIFVYDATVRVPLVFRYPALLPSRSVYRGPVRTVDIAPTILSMAGLPGAKETQGTDLVPAFRGKVPPPDLAQYSESLVAELGFGMAPLHAIRKDGFKLVRAPRPELYDLRKDPHELTNIIGAEPRRAALLGRELDAVLRDCEKRTVAARSDPMTTETMETLMSLGYLTPAGDRAAMGSRDPKDGIAIYEKLEDARHLAQKRRWADSEKLLREILKEIPEHESARNVLALTLLKQGRLEEARAEYLASLKIDPKQDRVLTLLGTLALLRGDETEARRLYLSALEITPGFVEAICNLGFLEQIDGRWDAARAWYDRAQAADPTFPRGNRLAADLWYERGDFQNALRNYQSVLKVHPRDFESLVQAGNCSRRLGDRREAERRFREAKTLRPDSWVPEYNLACLLAAEGRSGEALTLLGTEVLPKGFHSPGLLLSDRDLAAVRLLPGFDDLVRQARTAPGMDER